MMLYQQLGFVPGEDWHVVMEAAANLLENTEQALQQAPPAWADSHSSELRWLMFQGGQDSFRKAYHTGVTGVHI